ncbi:MAG: hypothetical protein WDZ29_04215 [Balneolaceae bacterium]
MTLLQLEAEKLPDVIENVPWSKAPPDSSSILDQLQSLSEFQNSRVIPFLRKITTLSGTPDLKFSEYLNTDKESDSSEIQILLRTIADTRKHIVQFLTNLPDRVWGTAALDGKDRLTLMEMARLIEEQDRITLGKIGDTVMTWQKDFIAQRSIEKKKPSRPNNN